MKIVAYFINYNDSFYIPFFARHYFEFCDKIVMYDNFSSDDSVQIARSLGIEVQNFGFAGVLDDQQYLNVKNHCWKEQIGKGVDYVIVVDADEFLVIDEEIPKESTAPIVTGYNIISENLPEVYITELTTGEQSPSYSKQAIFSPNHITEINFDHGCHTNRMTGRIIREGNCRLLHYRQIGGLKRILERHAEYRTRMSKFNKRYNLGGHYLHTDEQKRVEWETLTARATKLW